MPRTPEFDRDNVLESAMGAFWENGYEATSMTDLLAATGLSKSSLYSGFGGKRELFIAAYDRYRAQRTDNLNRVLETHPAPMGIRAFFEQIIHTGVDDWQRFGCMSTNQAVELSKTDPEISDRVAQDQQLLEDAFTTHLQQGQRSGSVASAIDARQAGSAMVAAFAGFQLTVRSGIDRRRLERALNYLMTPLEPVA